MKILCVIDNLSTGGAQRQIINLARGLHRRGHEVSVFCYSSGTLLADSLERQGIAVHTQLKRSRYSLAVIRGLQKLIDQERYQAVVSFMTTPNFYSILAALRSKIRPAVIVSERFCDIPGHLNLLERVARQFYRFGHRIVVNSHHQRTNFVGRYRWMKSRVVTIYNGYDLDKFIPTGQVPMNNPPQVLVIASVSRYKNGLCLVKALNILRTKHGLQPRVDWVGQRVMRGDRLMYYREMEGEIRRFGLTEQWAWLDQRKDIVDLLHKHDVLVHPSYGEGLPNVVCEAMACGRPVIVSRTLDHPLIVKDGENGFLFNWRDPSDLAEKMKLFFALPEDERRHMGEMGRRYAEKSLSIERYVSDFEGLLLDAVK